MRTSIAHNKYSTFFFEGDDSISAKSAAQILSLNLAVVYILTKLRRKPFYFGCVFTGALLETNNLRLNLSVYQICCSIFPREQGESVYQICCLRNHTGDKKCAKIQ